MTVASVLLALFCIATAGKIAPVHARIRTGCTTIRVCYAPAIKPSYEPGGR